MQAERTMVVVVARERADELLAAVVPHVVERHEDPAGRADWRAARRSLPGLEQAAAVSLLVTIDPDYDELGGLVGVVVAAGGVLLEARTRDIVAAPELPVEADVMAVDADAVPYWEAPPGTPLEAAPGDELPAGPRQPPALRDVLHQLDVETPALGGWPLVWRALRTDWLLVAFYVLVLLAPVIWRQPGRTLPHDDVMAFLSLAALDVASGFAAAVMAFVAAAIVLDGEPGPRSGWASLARPAWWAIAGTATLVLVELALFGIETGASPAVAAAGGVAMLALVPVLLSMPLLLAAAWQQRQLARTSASVVGAALAAWRHRPLELVTWYLAQLLALVALAAAAPAAGASPLPLIAFLLALGVVQLGLAATLRPRDDGSAPSLDR